MKNKIENLKLLRNRDFCFQKSELYDCVYEKTFFVRDLDSDILSALKNVSTDGEFSCFLHDQEEFIKYEDVDEEFIKKYKDKKFTAQISLDILNVRLNLENALGHRDFAFKEKKEFYLFEENIHYKKSDEHHPKTFESYPKYFKFLDILKEVANKEQDSVLWLFYKDLIEIDLNSYSRNKEYILKCNYDSLDILISLFKNKEHFEQKKYIFKKVLYKILENKKEGQDDNLKVLIEKFTYFVTEINEDYTLYVSEYSFDEVRELHEERQNKYFNKISETVNSSFTKILITPITSYTIVFHEKLNVNIFFSIMISIIYSYIILLQIGNQKITIESTREQYTKQNERFQKKCNKIKNLKEIFDKLEERVSKVKKSLNVLKYIAIILPLASVGFVIYKNFCAIYLYIINIF